MEVHAGPRARVHPRRAARRVRRERGGLRTEGQGHRHRHEPGVRRARLRGVRARADFDCQPHTGLRARDVNLQEHRRPDEGRDIR